MVPPRIKDDDPQKIYDSVPRTEEVFNLNKNDLELSDRLGKWNWTLRGAVTVESASMLMV